MKTIFILFLMFTTNIYAVEDFSADSISKATKNKHQIIINESSKQMILKVKQQIKAAQLQGLESLTFKLHFHDDWNNYENYFSLIFSQYNFPKWLNYATECDNYNQKCSYQLEEEAVLKVCLTFFKLGYLIQDNEGYFYENPKFCNYDSVNTYVTFYWDDNSRETVKNELKFMRELLNDIKKWKKPKNNGEKK